MPLAVQKAIGRPGNPATSRRLSICDPCFLMPERARVCEPNRGQLAMRHLCRNPIGLTRRSIVGNRQSPVHEKSLLFF
jgi:hypothetical protein